MKRCSKKTLKRFLRDCYIDFRIQLRILRLHFIKMEIPEDAKSSEQMLAEIRQRAQAYLDNCYGNRENE